MLISGVYADREPTAEKTHRQQSSAVPHPAALPSGRAQRKAKTRHARERKHAVRMGVPVGVKRGPRDSLCYSQDAGEDNKSKKGRVQEESESGVGGMVEASSCFDSGSGEGRCEVSSGPISSSTLPACWLVLISCRWGWPSGPTAGFAPPASDTTESW